jgi:hypothetical protein
MVFRNLSIKLLTARLSILLEVERVVFSHQLPIRIKRRSQPPQLPQFITLSALDKGLEGEFIALPHRFESPT